MTGCEPVEEWHGELCVAEDHASFAGHFPGFPILPGAVLLDAALAEIVCRRGIDWSRWRIASAKFLATVRPGARLSLHHAMTNGETIRFVIHGAGGRVASGVLSAVGTREEDRGRGA
ncbi:MAG: beta-hydroxyacyl-ACP dehydratase [Rhodospirillales bacterium]|nr:beta-hydroxyacyl-ACP dehydratase [Rhodospirillales bacterium]